MMTVKEIIFGPTKEGKETRRYLLTGKSGMEVEVTNFGACIIAIRVPDTNKTLRDVVLG